MSIISQLQAIWKELPPQTRLVAVSKFHPPEMIMEAYKAGQKIFGESKMQEITSKYEVLPTDIEWHFIGHLQTNKVKYIAPFVTMIQSVDSVRLLEEINKHAANCNRTIQVLLEIHIAREENKFGFTIDSCRKFLQQINPENFRNVEIAGLMGMATFTDDKEQIRSEFKSLAAFFNEAKTSGLPGTEKFRELSMGMSDDYRIAIEEGSTIIRVGSKIFGERS